jgi:hypothetical protein
MSHTNETAKGGRNLLLHFIDFFTATTLSVSVLSLNDTRFFLKTELHKRLKSSK